MLTTSGNDFADVAKWLLGSQFLITNVAGPYPNDEQNRFTVAFTHFRFVESLRIERIEVYNAYFTGIQVQSVRNSVISSCYVHYISDIVSVNPPNPANERHGIVVGGASQNLSISGCRSSHARHAVTTGGSSGANQNDVQSNIVVSNHTSMLSDTAHFDTHQPAENVTFIGCVADGGVPATPTRRVRFSNARPQLLYHRLFAAPG